MPTAEHLKYSSGIFINVDFNRLEFYDGNYKNCIHAFAVWLEDDHIKVTRGSWKNENDTAENKCRNGVFLTFYFVSKRIVSEPDYILGKTSSNEVIFSGCSSVSL
jgi:hypothetical protein